MNTETTIRIQHWLQNGTPQDKIRGLIMALAQQAPKQGNFEQKTAWYFNACIEIDRAKQKALGFSGSTFHSNKLMQLLGIYLAKVWNFGLKEIPLLETMRNELYAKNAWYGVKTMHLITGANAMNAARTYIKPGSRIWGIDEVTRFYTTNYQEGFTANLVNQLFAGIAEYRRYGIKPAFFPNMLSRITGLNGPGWCFEDANNLLIDGARILAQGTLAFGGIAAHKPHTFINDVFYANESSKFHGYEFTNAEMYFAVTKEGELDFSLGYGLITYRDLAEEYGTQFRYEYERLHVALKLFNLTVTQIIAEKTSNGFLRRLTGLATGQAKDIPSLILPRLRYLEDPNLTKEIEREIEEDIEETKKRRHVVECFRRKLPKGAKPSQEAIRLAAENNFVLREGETFVKQHKRGSGEELPRVREVTTRGAFRLKKKARHKA
jgi:hypothetical protein